MGNVNGLLVNGIAEPLGLDDRTPRLSWRYEGEAIAEYVQVRVAGSAEALTRGEALWDSGKQKASSPCLDYGGPALAGCTRYWWKVSVWDAEGRNEESPVARWETGLFAEDWHADWIWHSRRKRINDFAYLRKEFTLKKPVVYAKLFASAHHAMQLHLNGERIGGYGSPAPTQPWGRKYYLAYDVTGLLQPGPNAVAAAALYLGGGGQNYVDGLPGFRLQLHVAYDDGTTSVLTSNTTWQALREIPHLSGTPYQQNRRLSAVEDYDARKLDAGWLLPGYASDNCRKAVKAKIGRDEWPMSWQPIPEGAVEEEIVPAEVQPASPLLEDGCPVRVFDTGTIVSGWPRISLPGKAGATVRLRYSEDLDEHGRVKHNVCNEKSEHYYDQYTMRGDARETWSPDFSYKAFRYVEVTGYPGQIIAGDRLVICSAHTELGCEGGFRCSDDLLNRMYAASILTQKNNTLGQIVDCPHREQAQYLADTDLQAETLLYNFDARLIVEKTLSDFADGQLENGTFPFVFPANYEHPDFHIRIPEWDLHFATLLWKLYGATGDERLLARYYEPMKRMIDAYMRTIDPSTGLIPLGEGWHISDWPYPTVEHEGEHLTVQQVKAWQALRIVADSAVLIGRPEEAVVYTERAELLRGNILKHLYDSGRKKFRDSSGSDASHQGVGAIALYAGLLDDEDREAAIGYIAAKPWESKTVLSLPLLRLLFENGHAAAAYGLLRREEYPGWGYMLANGATTMWEGWDDIESHCHAWNGYPARLMQEYIAGIQAAAPGFARALIRPYMPPDLTFAEATVQTVRGHIFAGWRRGEDGSIRIRLELPNAVTARLAVRLPDGGQLSDIREGGVTIWERGRDFEPHRRIAGIKLPDDGVELELEPGRYDLTIGTVPATTGSSSL